MLEDWFQQINALNDNLSRLNFVLRLPKEGSTTDLKEVEYVVDIKDEPIPPFTELNGKIFYWCSQFWDIPIDEIKLHEYRKNIPDKVGVQIFLVKHFGKKMDSDEVIAWGKENGYLPATFKETLAFAKAHTEIQKQFYIVALGSFAMHGGGRCVAVPGSDSSRRIFGNGWFDGRWSSGSRFLFVRK